jgi:hypothetical protein
MTIEFRSKNIFLNLEMTARRLKERLSIIDNQGNLVCDSLGFSQAVASPD